MTSILHAILAVLRSFQTLGSPIRTDPVGTTPQPITGEVTVSGVSGTVTANQGTAGGTPWPVTGTVAVTSAGLTNLDVALSTLAKESGGNLATIAAKDFSTSAKQDTGNTSLGTVKTNTDSLVTAGGGGYVRQDSTATIAKESGGNLATIAAKDFATSAKQDTGNTSLAAIKTDADNLDVALSTRLKPADTLAGVTALGSITSALPAGSNVIGHVIVDSAPTTTVSETAQFNTVLPVPMATATNYPIQLDYRGRLVTIVDDAPSLRRLLEYMLVELRSITAALSENARLHSTDVRAITQRIH